MQVFVFGFIWKIDTHDRERKCKNKDSRKRFSKDNWRKNDSKYGGAWKQDLAASWADILRRYDI